MRLSRRARFNWWIVVVIAALAAPLWMLIGGATTDMRIAAAVQSTLALSVMVLFLAEAPVNAIRLPWWLSLVIAWTGAWWLMFLGNTLWYFVHPERWMATSLCVFITVVWAQPSWRRENERRRYSTWTIVPVLWNPVLWVVPWPQFTPTMRATWPQAVVLLALFFIPATFRPRWKAFAVPLFVVVSVINLALTRWS